MPTQILIDNDKLTELYIEKKYSIKKIAPLLNLSRCCVRGNLVRQGIPIRTLSEQLKLTPQHRKIPEQWKSHKGAKHPSWKGGRTKNTQGYIRVRQDGHPRAGKNGYVLEHILVWEKVHNKPVPSGWVIHHLNGIRDDNRPENLVASPRGKHSRRELAEIFKKRIRELEAKVNLLERTLDSQQMIWWGEN